MHAVVTRATLHDFEGGRQFLRKQVVPRVSQAPGFVAAFWVRIAEDQGTGMIVFESEDAARTMADEMPRQTPGDVTTVDSIEVGEVVERA